MRRFLTWYLPLLASIAGAAVFPLDHTTFPLSVSAGSRCLARLAVALGASAGAVASIGPRRAKQPAAEI